MKSQETLSKINYDDSSYSTSKLLKFYDEKNYNLKKTDNREKIKEDKISISNELKKLYEELKSIPK